MKFTGYISCNESDFQSYYLAVTEELKKMKNVVIQKKTNFIYFKSQFFGRSTTDSLISYDQGKIYFDSLKRNIEFSFNIYRSLKMTLGIILFIILLSFFLFWQINFAIIPFLFGQIIHYLILKKNFKIFIENIEKRVGEQTKHENNDK